MLSLRFNDLHPLNRLRDEMEHLFDSFIPQNDLFEPLPSVAMRGAAPAVNLWEEGDYFYAEAEIPGMTMDGIEVTVVGNELTIRGERPAHQPEKAAFHRRERPVGKFQRTLRLPMDIDADHVEASLSAGVLTIKLPKAPTARPRKIAVQSA